MRYATLLLAIFCLSSSLALAQGTGKNESAKKASRSDKHIMTLTWVDLAFVNHFPIPNTRFYDFSDVNFGGFVGLNFMIMDFKPLWLFTGVLVDWNLTNSNRLDMIIDFGISIGLGWRFTLANKFFLTPRVSYGYMLHYTYGDYYNAPTIYLFSHRTGKKRYHWFSDQYMQYEIEFAYDVSPPSKKVQSEIFFSPSFIHFMEKHRQGLEIGYKLGFRMKVDAAQKEVLYSTLSGKIVDEETGYILKGAVPVVTGGKAEKTDLKKEEMFAYTVDSAKDYTLKVEYQGYNPLVYEVENKRLKHNERTFVVLALKLTREWGIYGHIYEKETNKPLWRVKVLVTEKSSGKEIEMKTDRKGDFRMKLKPDTDYGVFLKKRSYFAVRGEFTSKGKKPGWYDITKFMETAFQEVKVGATIEFGNIYYDSGKWNIRPDVAPELDKIVQFLNDNPKIAVELGAHTDSRGSAKQNQVLSQKRAQSCVDYLISKGIEKSRITAMGYGESKIKNRCVDGVACSWGEHQANRRTEIKVTKILF